jgi:hypoxanthine phosphoribosyltransferase
MEKIYLDDKAFGEMLENLTKQVIESKREFKRVVGIERGGLRISLPLAIALNIPHQSVRISHYDGCEKREAPKVTYLEGVNEMGNCLIVDDLIDTGATMETFDEVFGLEKNAVAVLFWKRGTRKPDFYVDEKPEKWIVFPWEEQ